MGFFDRLKGNKDSIQPKQQDKKIKINNGRTQIEFRGLKDIDGKILASVVVTYIDEKNMFKQGEFFVEPRLAQDNSGKWIDVTEQYYRDMSVKAEEQMQYFFDAEAIMPIRPEQGYGQGSNYIGGFEVHQDGSWSRNYPDPDFRERYREKAIQRENELKSESAQKHAAEVAATERYIAQQKEQGLSEQLRRETYGEDESGYVGRLTQEDYNRFYGNRHPRTQEDAGIR